MGSKRSALHMLLDPPVKRPRLSTESPPAIGMPQVKHRPHPDCRSGINFHSVAYPLNLLPFRSWYALHFRKTGPSGALEIPCPVCAKPEPASMHHQKLFLVAERLLFDFETLPTAARQANEEANWEVNFQLGILDPFVEDLQGHTPGGKRSREKRCYPFENEFEMGAVMRLIEKGGALTQANWTVWRDMIDRLPLGGTKSDQQSQFGVGQGDAVDVASAAMELKEDMLWVEQLGEEDIAESHDHLHYLKEILREKNEALAMHQATGTSPPLSLTQSHKLITDDIKETEDIIRTREVLDRRISNSTRFGEGRLLGEVNVNSLTGTASASKASSFAKPASKNPFSRGHSSALLLTPPSSSPSKEIEEPPSNHPYIGLSNPETNISASSEKREPAKDPPNQQNISLRTLPDLYEKLDLIERTSYVGTCFLEAYAEFLRWDMCGRCWFREMIVPKEEVGGWQGLVGRGGI